VTTALREESAAARWTIGALSVIVCVSVAVVLFAFPRHATPGGPSVLATLNAVMNAGSAVFLVAGYAFIRRKNVRAHRFCMLSAFGLSILFLVGYLLHHAQVGSVPFRGHGALRTVYFSILIPHIVLAAVVLPLALLTLLRAWRRSFVRHRAIARYTLPIWLYVSVSGVAVYWMLYHLGR
jgi:putative membrane protein